MTILSCIIGANRFLIDTSAGTDISIPLIFNGSQPAHFGVPPATASVFQDGSFIGDTRKGGGCNVRTYSFIPHCNGTHTETVGHILYEAASIGSLNELLVPTTLISVSPTLAGEVNDSYTPDKQLQDLLITRSDIKNALDALGNDLDWLGGLIVRSLPNDESKRERDYLKEAPAFFSYEAMQFISKLPVKHLIVDLPSVDRLYDEGRLSGHHTFWNVAENQQALTEDVRSDRTITEMVYAPDSLADGHYFSSIQVPNFVEDAAPSRVLLYPACREK
ncbi:MAG: cyclase family protein [Calditrichia bacterium]